jgi:ketosteroid isomerase-like protein
MFCLRPSIAIAVGADEMSATNDDNARMLKTIESLEQQESQALRDADVLALQALWADDLIVNSTANLIAGKHILLDMIKEGRLRLRTHERRPVRFSTFGDIVVVTGNEVSELVSETADFKLFTSYMNVWKKRKRNWQLVARHVGLIQRVKPEPLQ